MRHTAQVPRARVGVAGAVAALTVAVLGACTGDAADPTTSTPTSSASSSSASPTSPATSASPSPTSAYVPVKPKFPAAAKKQTDAGAVAFAEYYWEAVNFAVTQPDANILITLSDAECQLCTRHKELASDLVETRTRFDGRMLRVKESSIVVSTSNELRVQTLLDLLSAERVGEDGSSKGKQDPGPANFIFKLDWAGSSWKVQILGDAG